MLGVSTWKWVLALPWRWRQPESQKSWIGKKATHHSFVYISFLSHTTTSEKCLISRFMEDVALWSDSSISSSFFLSNQRTVVERHSLLMCRRLKEIIKCFYLVLNHQVIRVATLSYQLSWIMFCNRYRFTLYRAQRKSEHLFHFFVFFFFSQGVYRWQIWKYPRWDISQVFRSF